MRTDDYLRWRDRFLAITRENVPPRGDQEWPGVLVIEGPDGTDVVPTAPYASDRYLWAHALQIYLPAMLIERQAVAYGIVMEMIQESALVVRTGAKPNLYEVWDAVITRRSNRVPDLGPWQRRTSPNPGDDPFHIALLAS